jgi:hypothetical protein
LGHSRADPFRFPLQSPVNLPIARRPSRYFPLFVGNAAEKVGNATLAERLERIIIRYMGGLQYSRYFVRVNAYQKTMPWGKTFPELLWVKSSPVFLHSLGRMKWVPTFSYP